MADKRRVQPFGQNGKNTASPGTRRRSEGVRRQADRGRASQARMNADRRGGKAAAKSVARPDIETRAGKRSAAKSKAAVRAKAAPKGLGRKRKRWSLGKKIATVLITLFVLLFGAVVAVIASKYAKIKTVNLDTDALNISDEIELDETGYLNVALFGLDGRATDPSMGSRSDTIIVASLNRETGEIKMSSIYRDTLLEIDDSGTYNKCNSAYAFGAMNSDKEGAGAQAAVAMLNKNLDLNIEKYISVDFAALVDVVDAVGGVEIEVTEEEIPYLNNYAVEVIENTGVDSAPVVNAGLQTLNGVQATGYARIRYTKGDDFKRTERQRAVIEQIVKKVQQSDLRTLNKIIDKVFPKVETNFKLDEILAYAKNFKKYTMGETQGFPNNNATAKLSGIGDCVIPQTLESNVKQLHKFLFGDDGYSPSSTVTSISAKVTSKAASGGDSSGSSGSDSDDDDYYNSYSGSSSYDNSYDSDYNYNNSNNNNYDYDSSYDNSSDGGSDNEDSSDYGSNSDESDY